MLVPRNYGQEGLPVFHIMSCIKAESAGLALPALFWRLVFHDQIWNGSLPLSIQLILWALHHYNCQSFPSIKGLIWKAQWKSHILHETALIYVFPSLFLRGIMHNGPAWLRYSLSTCRQRHRKFVCCFFGLMFFLSQYLPTAGGRNNLQKRATMV